MSRRARTSLITSAATVAVLGVVAIAVITVTHLQPVVHADPTGIKYTGAGSCAAAACHGAQEAKEEPACRHNENTQWSNKDAHSKAYNDPKKGLVSPKGQEISKKMGLGDATKAERCLTCHALSGFNSATNSRIFLKAADINPATKYNVEDGNSCDACHGPADKYLAKHAEKGWTAKMRADLGSQKLYDEWGLFDTKNLKFRANQCLSCHLKIEADMIAGGHPELSGAFELDSMTNIDQGQDWVHWRKGPAWSAAKVWAMGQVISLREAAAQLDVRTASKADAAQLKDCYKLIIAHALPSRQIAVVFDAASKDAIDAQLKAINDGWADGAKVSAACKELAKAADGLADKFNTVAVDQPKAEALLKGVASEGEQAGKAGYMPANKYCQCLMSLWSCVTVNAKPADAEAKQNKINDLFTPLGDPGTYKADDFAKAAKDVGTATFPGGASIPLPAGGPQ
jgi:hypothetical protein